MNQPKCGYIRISSSDGAFAEAIEIFEGGVVVLWKLTTPENQELYGVVDSLNGRSFDAFNEEQARYIYKGCCDKINEINILN